VFIDIAYIIVLDTLTPLRPAMNWTTQLDIKPIP